MLVLSREENQGCQVFTAAGPVRVSVQEIRKSQVKLGFAGPCAVLRDELCTEEPRKSLTDMCDLCKRVEALQRERDDLLEACKDLLPHAEASIRELNQRMVGDLYPQINADILALARTVIARYQPQPTIPEEITP